MSAKSELTRQRDSMYRTLSKRATRVVQLERALEEIANVVPSQANTLAWRLVLIARKAIGQCDDIGERKP